MSARLLISIITTLVWEAMLAAIWLWGLPLLGIELPLAGLILAMAVLAAYAVTSFHVGSRALGRKAIIGIPDMVGGQGKVVIPLTPEGMVKIGSERWAAKSVEGNINKGELVEVVRQEGLKLFVRKSDSGNE